MTRRRLILAASVAVVALGAVWWLLAGRLTTEEQRLVGTWRTDRGVIPESEFFQLDADRHCRYWKQSQHGGNITIEFAGPWSVCGRTIVMDGEANSFFRAARPLLSALGIPHGEGWVFDLEPAADDEMVTNDIAGGRRVWTRVCGD
jgi:hypothetical protein